MKEKIDKALEIAMIIVFVTVCIAGIIFLIAFKEMLNDHRCYNLPLNEFYQDKKCEKYWDMRNWSDEIGK